ncbi:MAG: hypothetical protein ACLUI3_16430, partial [Christensenellales bacterium]
GKGKGFRPSPRCSLDFLKYRGGKFDARVHDLKHRRQHGELCDGQIVLLALLVFLFPAHWLFLLSDF